MSSHPPVVEISDADWYQREVVERPVDLTCPERGVNEPWLPSKTRELWNRGYSDQEMFELLYQATRVVKHRTITESEIKRAIATIIGTDADSLRLNGTGRDRQKVHYEPAYLEQVAARIPEPVDEDYLAARSQFTCWNRTPAGFLHKLYKPDENVWITSNAKSGDGEIWTHDGPNQRFDELDHLTTGCQGVWFLTNPISGELHAIERCKKKSNPDGLSFTTLECVNAWRYLMFETDAAPKELWRKALVQFALKIVAIYSSGGNGDHCLVRLEANSKAQWESICQQHDEQLIRLGACPGSLTARRLSRLPNCMREQTGRLQTLLYLSPDADGRPICQIPARKTRGVRHHNESPKL